MFDFEINLKSDNALVLFTGQIEGDDGYYGDKIDTILKLRNKPYDKIIFIFPKYITEAIEAMLIDGDKLESNLKRINSLTPIGLFSFDSYANLELYRNLPEADELTINLSELKYVIVKHGLFSLVEKRKDKIILKSPSGTVFKKPSGVKFSEFIKASELAAGFSENQFVAFTLLSHRPKRSHNNKIQHIWMDTSSISSYIEALIGYITQFNGDECRLLQYHSFQSYGKNGSGGYNACLPQITDNIWVIISASSSNNMGADICKERKDLQHDQVVTLLSYTDSKGYHKPLCGSDTDAPKSAIRKGDNIVVNIAKYSDAHKLEETYGSEVPVEIIGENFTAQVEAPTAVLLRQVHGPKEIKAFAEPNNLSTNLLVNKHHNGRLRPVFFDFEAFGNNNNNFFDEYQKWLNDIVDWYVPRNVGAIIYDKNDTASCLLLKHIKDITDYKNIEEIDINGEIHVTEDLAIIALLPVMTRGNTLVKLNSDLRLDNHSAQRIFITPFAICSSKKAYTAFVNSLTFAPKNLKYQFVNFRRLFIGHREDKYSWERELTIVEGFSHTIWKERTQKLREKSQGMNTIGISCTATKDKLDFNKDFAFWGPNYEPNKVNHTSVYVTVSAILQNLREKLPTASDKESLYAQVYQHSVLDPSNFSRFNDPLLQSCLWRCAYDRELDYRSQNDLSKQFCDIVIRLAECRAKGEHNATLDLLVGIAVRKIQLTTMCLGGLTDHLTNILKDHDVFKEILSFIKSNFKHLTQDDEVI